MKLQLYLSACVGVKLGL